MRRIFRIFVYLSILLALTWYGKNFNPAITLSQCMKDPQHFDKSRIEIGTETTISRLAKDGFYIRQMNRELWVKGDPKGLTEGSFISLIAIFHAPGWLEMQKVYQADRRRMKIVLSLFPPIIWLFFFFKYFSSSLHPLGFRSR
jgi:hypothetical protein